MATTIDGRTTHRWTLAIPNTDTRTTLAAWLGQHVDAAMVTVPQTVSCDGDELSIDLTVAQGGDLDPLVTTAAPALMSEPPIPVTCVHRWLAAPGEPGRRSCLECGLEQVTGWVNADAP